VDVTVLLVVNKFSITIEANLKHVAVLRSLFGLKKTTLVMMILRYGPRISLARPYSGDFDMDGSAEEQAAQDDEQQNRGPESMGEGVVGDTAAEDRDTVQNPGGLMSANSMRVIREKKQQSKLAAAKFRWSMDDLSNIPTFGS